MSRANTGWWPWAPSSGFAFHRIEGLFNPVGQQRGGILWELLRRVPGRDRAHPVTRELAQAPFNTNPVLAGYCIGALAVHLARESRARDSAETAAAVAGIRETMAPLLASAGDRLIWGCLRPLLSLVGLSAAIFRLGEPAIWYWLGYNAVQLYWRRRAWSVGSRGEPSVYQEIRDRTLQRWAAALGRAGRFALGLSVGAVVTGLVRGAGAGASMTWLLVFALGLALAAGGRCPPLAFGWVGIALSALLAWVRLAVWRNAD